MALFLRRSCPRQLFRRLSLRYVEQSADDFDIIEIYHPFNGKCFLRLCAHSYPIQGGRSTETMIPRSLVLDACRILTGCYREDVHIYDIKDNRVAEEELLRPGEYFYQVIVRQPEAKCLITGLPTSSPKSFSVGRPSWAHFRAADRSDYWSYMSEQAKTSDSFVCSLTRVSQLDCGRGHMRCQLRKGFSTRHVEVSQQLYPAGPIPWTLAGDQLVHDLRNYITLNRIVHRLWDTFLLVFYPLYPGIYFAYFLADGDGYAHSYHLLKLKLAERTDPYLLFIRFAHTIFRYRLKDYSGSQPTDALPALTSIRHRSYQRHQKHQRRNLTQRKRVNPVMLVMRITEDIMNVDSDSSDQDRDDENSLSTAAEAQGMQLSEELEDLVGEYYPDRDRIAKTAAEYVLHNPAID
ncbi:hypothetical protein BT96DRAFT_993236 [Gymnopus androsaceus JB14]|uniref:HNH nuclease domain-containing protein n=1 Tax=Gymnopus androsaceus JB14 TaxID=1447944 RepID=A0A6A4HP41_9AGAR|nr:hypothetical protein BT96DRAFT_993236 [Gymnopus androsaceus JB14]